MPPICHLHPLFHSAIRNQDFASLQRTSNRVPSGVHSPDRRVRLQACICRQQTGHEIHQNFHRFVTTTQMTREPNRVCGSSPLQVRRRSSHVHPRVCFIHSVDSPISSALIPLIRHLNHIGQN